MSLSVTPQHVRRRCADGIAIAPFPLHRWCIQLCRAQIADNLGSCSALGLLGSGVTYVNAFRRTCSFK